MRTRRKTILRKTPLKRSGFIRRVSKKRGAQNSLYSRVRKEWLAEHPYCQIFIVRHGLDEAVVIANKGWVNCRWNLDKAMDKVPPATSIHHRNKRNGRRLCDTRWFMAASQPEHDWTETHLNEARELGISLPVQADPDGRWAGVQAITTDELMRRCCLERTE